LSKSGAQKFDKRRVVHAPGVKTEPKVTGGKETTSDTALRAGKLTEFTPTSMIFHDDLRTPAASVWALDLRCRITTVSGSKYAHQEDLDRSGRPPSIAQ